MGGPFTYHVGDEFRVQTCYAHAWPRVTRLNFGKLKRGLFHLSVAGRDGGSMNLEKASEAAHFHPAESNHLVVVLVADTFPGLIPPSSVCGCEVKKCD